MSGELLTLDVGPVAHGGHCVARHEGRVVFVRHALPGERVRVQVTERKDGYWRGDAVEVLTPAPDRVEAPCVYAHPGGCGGCDFQHASHDGQLALKSAVLREQLVRLGGLSEEDVAGYRVEALPGGPLGWRTRVQYAVDRATGRAGLHEHRSHAVVPVERCVIATEAIQDADVLGRDWTGCTTVAVVDASVEDELSVYVTREKRRGGHGRRGAAEMVEGPETVRESAAGRGFELAPDAFWQVHPRAADTFTRVVLELLDPQEGESAWDLYGGAGLFAAALAETVGPSGEVTVVETDGRCDPAGNLGDLKNVAVVDRDVAKVVDRLPQPDLVVLDPPRSGAGRGVLTGIAEARPRAIAYVACDPAALGRDVRILAGLGWRLVRLRAFDAFPMTHHFETIALFEPV